MTLKINREIQCSAFRDNLCRMANPVVNQNSYSSLGYGYATLGIDIQRYNEGLIYRGLGCHPSAEHDIKGLSASTASVNKRNVIEYRENYQNNLKLSKNKENKRKIIKENGKVYTQLTQMRISASSPWSGGEAGSRLRAGVV